MPTYDYKCNACGHRMELFQSMKDAPKRKCPECGKNALERLIGTGAALIFKGSGFYQTDYRSESYKKAAAEAEKPAAAASADAKGGESKSEAKADAKTEAKGAEAKGSDKRAEVKKSGETK